MYIGINQSYINCLQTVTIATESLFKTRLKPYLFERAFNVWANRSLLFKIIICLFCIYNFYVFWIFLNYIVQHNGQPVLFYCALKIK